MTGNQDKTQDAETSFALDDPSLLRYVEDNVYSDLVDELNSEIYFVENVAAKYISNEYLEELDYNSQANVYFGYTVKELEEQFEDTKYIFTLGEDGKTAVKKFEPYDDTFDKTIMNLAVGTGVILLCVTVSVLTNGASPAVSVIFAMAAQRGTEAAVSSGVIGGLSAGVITGVQTGDFDQALKAAALTGSESFKWGAFTGALTGGAAKTTELRGATLNGLTMNQAAMIQRESKYPLDVIKSFHSMDEYAVYKAANLKGEKVNGKWALTRKIDWDFIGDATDGRTNEERVIDGLAPLDPTGKYYEVHHIGQKADSPFAILTNKEHHSNHGILHPKTNDSEIDRNVFAPERRAFWLDLLKKERGGL